MCAAECRSKITKIREEINILTTQKQNCIAQRKTIMNKDIISDVEMAEAEILMDNINILREQLANLIDEEIRLVDFLNEVDRSQMELKKIMNAIFQPKPDDN